jgi:toxin-antitoxin system PIN domain toxin
MTLLLDVNVLISLAWPNHVHHEAAHRWFSARDSAAWATTPFTESGFVRVSSSPGLPGAVTPAEALLMLNAIREVRDHRFLADDIEQVVGEWLSPEQVATHRLVTDCHLLAVAARHSARLATFDRGLARLAADASMVTLVPA